MSSLTRRELLRGGAAALLAGAGGAPPARAAELPADLLAFHRECLVLDLHIDTLLWMRSAGYDIGVRHRNWLPRSPFGWHLDLPRAEEGGLDAAVMGLVINPREVREELMLPLRLLAWWEESRGFPQTLATLDLLAEAERRHSERLVFVRRGSDLRRAVAEGKFAALAGLEGAHGIEGRLDHVQAAYERGLRMIGLVHFQANEAAYPMTVSSFDAQGLTPFGFDLVAEMERLGMVVDVAHLNGPGVDDALRAMKRPFVVSHSACRGVHDHPRNLSDGQIRAIAEKGGVIGIAFGAMFVGSGGFDGFVRHVEHALRVGGADCVALGSDFDGAIVPVSGMEDVTVYPQITRALLERGHDREIVRKILGENALRVLTEVCG